MTSETRLRAPLAIEKKLINSRLSRFIIYFQGEYCGWMDDTSLLDIAYLNYARNVRFTYM